MALHGPVESSAEIVPIMHVLHASISSSVTSLPHSVHSRQLPQSVGMIIWDSGIVSDSLGVTLPFSSKGRGCPVSWCCSVPWATKGLFIFIGMWEKTDAEHRLAPWRPVHSAYSPSCD